MQRLSLVLHGAYMGSMLWLGKALSVFIDGHTLLQNRGFFSGLRSFFMAPLQVLPTQIRSMYMETLMFDRIQGGFGNMQQSVRSL
ncbi:MAG: hypothetical protein CL930_08560 [Deltaproteobacteria bacterium]|nr:hypothetical protein [Deltaproteobacteria bacterium]